ncbi:MAG: efflux RND transporter periplasmic adaptor subunit [Acidobacteria bacterium]|nr:efflux RND transporter periplasmic adaptor subunit [Acidobacteriota bacterium]
MNSKLTLALKIVLPIVVLIAAALGAMTLAGAAAPPDTVEVEVRPPVVRTLTAELVDHAFTVRTQGTVRPRTESRVVPEVGGRVIWVSPDFVSGGFFEEGDPLLRLDSHDYQQAVVRAAAEVSAAKLRLAQEEAEAEIARAEWEELGEGAPPDLTARVPQLENARAGVAAAEANLIKTEQDLERTEIKAPYAGRVRDKAVDVGQFIAPGSQVGSIYAIDIAEIRLPLPDQDLAYLSNMPLVYRGQRGGAGPEVILRAQFAGAEHEWRGRLVRTEGEIDAASRMVHAVAQVRDPYGRGNTPGRPPLAVGMYVQAEILGDIVENVALIPRSALRDGNQVWVLDSADKLHARAVEILRLDADIAIIGAGLESGERVVLSALEFVADGMKVSPEIGS